MKEEGEGGGDKRKEVTFSLATFPALTTLLPDAGTDLSARSKGSSKLFVHAFEFFLLRLCRTFRSLSECLKVAETGLGSMYFFHF